MSAIARRKTHERDFVLMVAEAVTSSIVAGMAGTAQSRKAGRAITKYAQKIRFRPKAEAELPRTEDVMRLFGG